MAPKQIIFGPVGQDGSTVAPGDVPNTAKLGAKQAVVNGGTYTFVDFPIAGGDYGVKLTAQGTDILSLRWDAGALNEVNNQYSESFVMRIDSLPTGSQQMVHTIRHAGGVVLRFFITSAGQIAIESASNGVGRVALLNGAVAGDVVRITTVLQIGASAGAGQLTVKVYDDNTMTQLGSTYSSSAYTLGTASIAAVDFGLLTNPVGSGGAVTIADLQMSLGSLVEWTPYTPPAPPAASVRPTNVVSNAGGWANVGGSANQATALADESDTTYIESTLGSGEIVLALDALGSGDVTVSLRARWFTSGARVKVDLRQNGVLIATRTMTLFNTFGAISIALTSAENSLLTSPRTGLTVSLSAV